ncbi:MAG: pyridoxamine 5'-phosphate oxidase family protein [Candidatus Krumholzibacteria bacterium]|nr:pyridoxamine 5'-phosphate oxidase family protein [Candidatus Krumholzibacteria bacterium]MDH4336860.1 pyridoxamine 5'-phosphate oxidase family protein [Candidatus Krumholzibacteria bacterium]MDH5269191.1 pyridoxamine 5'-phosphate oxidase family protein [Candidatus Krumholzibacteria bacterium]MDH5628204.1 pyridoxamine 5'-phosphate oxidase family protein [Candidatus Krumholzibacteria bacterium]
MNQNKPGDRTRVRRIPKRGRYDRPTIDAILDEALVCHAGFVVEGQPFVIPTLHARDGDRVLIHGSAASRMLTTLETGVDVCLSVTLADGLVVARSAFHSSMNYRSVMLFGRARVVEEPAAKMEALRALVEHLIPGRWDDCRLPNDTEMKATLILELPIDEASAKVRTGGPIDDDEDYATRYWAGVLPFENRTGAPIPDEKLTPGIGLPAYLRNYTRKK